MLQPVFYYDFAVPECYLVAERSLSILPEVPEWQPINQAQLGSGQLLQEAETGLDKADFERRAQEYGLQPVRWPDPLPFESEPALLAATFAKQIGRAVTFSLAAFRQAYAAGLDLSQRDAVLIAGAACEMHPTALKKALSLNSVRERLQKATDEALEAGVVSVPAIRVGDRILQGGQLLEAAARIMSAKPS